MLASDLPAVGTISSQKAGNVRRVPSGHALRMPMDRSIVLRTARKSAGHCSVEWTNLFSGVGTDDVLHPNDSASHISQHKVDALVTRLREAGGIATR